jgi:UDP-N-acetyl-D-glucosamine dehydrogenase
MKVVVIGQGYVGLPLAHSAAVHGHHEVIGYDTDVSKVHLIQSGQSPIEDVNADDLDMMARRGYRATYAPAELAGADVYVVTVPTPLNRDGQPDLSYVIAAGTLIGPYLANKPLVVLESTVAPGTTEGEFARAIGYTSGMQPGVHYRLAFSPERIDPGNESWDFDSTPKLVAGFDSESLEVAEKFYASMIMRANVVPVATLKEAEFAKLLENTFRHVNIALVNEMGRHAWELGIDFANVTKAAGTKPYGFLRFTHGPGVGGHCLPIDSVYLGEHIRTGLGQPSRFIDLAVEVNNSQPGYVVQRAMMLLNQQRKSLMGARVLVLGYAYKPNTGDCRETPASAVIDRLAELGASVDVVEPFSTVKHKYVRQQIGRDRLNPIKLAEYDLAIVVTDHEVFRHNYRDIAEHVPAVLDTRHVGDYGFERL